jgi:putative ABC transport system permease protein
MALLVPILTFWGLWQGIIGKLKDEIIKNPLNTEIISTGVRDFTPYFFDELEKNPNIKFVIPESRATVLPIELKSDETDYAKSQKVYIKSTKKGDPYLSYVSLEDQNSEVGFNDIYINSDIAKDFSVQKGDTLIISLTRRPVGQIHYDSEQIIMNVRGVIPVGIISNDWVQGNLCFAKTIDDYLIGKSISKDEWYGSSKNNCLSNTYQKFRLYAKDIDTVEFLSDDFRKLNIEVDTNAAKIIEVKSLDKAFKIVFNSLLFIVVIGALASVISSTIYLVIKNRKSLAGLSLLGMGKMPLQLFISTQVIISSFIASLLACGCFILVSYMINQNFNKGLVGVDNICSLSINQLGLSVVIVVVVMFIASLLSYFKLQYIEPSEGMRDV